MTSLADWVATRDRVADAIDALAVDLRAADAGLDGRADVLAAIGQRTREGRFHVLLVGCFSTGKSTLVNALCGAAVLPVKINPCTAILTEVGFGPTPAVEVQGTDGHARELTPEAFLAEFQLRTADVAAAGAEAADRFAAVARARVRWPLPLLRDGVVLVDTPGLDDDPTRTRRTLASIDEADAVIFVLSATRFLGDLERRLLRDELLPRGLTNLFFATTMVDLLDAIADDAPAELARLTDRAKRALGPLCVVDGQDRFDERFFGIDARAGLAARWDRATRAPRAPDDLALARSGLAAFEASLTRFLVEERGAAVLGRVDGALRSIRAEVARRQALDAATAAVSAEELRRRLDELAPRFAELDAVAARVATTVDAFVVRRQQAVQQDLRAFLARCEDELPDAVAGFSLGPTAAFDLLVPGGRERVAAAVKEQLEQWLTERIATWQRELEPRMARALDDLRVELAVDAHDFDHLRGRIVADLAGVRWLPGDGPAVDGAPDPTERWFSLAIGAVFLSPATMAAGWTEGYEGALKGFGFWVAKVAVASLLGPVGWAALLVYAVADAVLLWSTGGGRLVRLRDAVAEGLRGKLVARADEVRDEVADRVAQGLAPLRDAVVAAAAADAAELRARIDDLVHERERATHDADARAAAWVAAQGAVERAKDAVDRARPGAAPPVSPLVSPPGSR